MLLEEEEKYRVWVDDFVELSEQIERGQLQGLRLSWDKLLI